MSIRQGRMALTKTSDAFTLDKKPARATLAAGWRSKPPLATGRLAWHQLELVKLIFRMSIRHMFLIREVHVWNRNMLNNYEETKESERTSQDLLVKL